MTICPTCGQIQKLSRKEHLSKMKIHMLSTAANHVTKTMRNDFMVRDFTTDADFKLYNNFQKLRYHGLIAAILDSSGNKLKGHWAITRNGWAFLRGDKQLPSYVLIKDNAIQSKSDDWVSLHEVDGDAAFIQTRFEYFNAQGEPVGELPRLPSAAQQLGLWVY